MNVLVLAPRKQIQNWADDLQLEHNVLALIYYGEKVQEV